MYNPKSPKAEEFINHEEILSTLEYANQNKNFYINDINVHNAKKVNPKINVNLLINSSNPLSFLF